MAKTKVIEAIIKGNLLLVEYEIGNPENWSILNGAINDSEEFLLDNYLLSLESIERGYE
jgi:hypothetical protein